MVRCFTVFAFRNRSLRALGFRASAEAALAKGHTVRFTTLAVALADLHVLDIDADSWRDKERLEKKGRAPRPRR